MKRHLRSLLMSLFVGLGASLVEGAPADPAAARQQVLDALKPFPGPTTRPAGATDAGTLRGKVMAGYQGWFTTPDDGAGLGWKHLGKGGKFAPGACNIEVWPDVSELTREERYPTPFKLADGSTAEVFSSHNRATVLRHFEWMRQYGIDGVFMQRFAGETRGTRSLSHFNTVLDSAREGANRSGRAYCVMYDLSGLRAGQMKDVMDDWKSLVDRMKLGRDPNDLAYQKHNGKPVVAVWGVGFNDKRDYTLAECEALLDFLKSDPTYGGNAVMLGVPYYFRTLDRDADKNPDLHRVLAKADIISPWAVGRYGTTQDAERNAQKIMKPDLAWCGERKLAYMPVIFPGFSWSNMKQGAKFDQIPRQGGKFLWKQAIEATKAGCDMLYIAMFDEMDEGTAIFKTTNNPPVGENRFVLSEGLPSDHYLWLAGEAGKVLRKEKPATENLPVR